MMNKKKEHTENVNVYLSKIGFEAAIWQFFFGSDAIFQDGMIQLPIIRPLLNEEFQNEILFLDGRRSVPVQTYFQFNEGILHRFDVYIFQSATDALAYVQLKDMIDSEVVFLVLGKNPSETLLQHVKSKFKGSRFFLAYPNNPLAKIAEIRIIGFLAEERLGLELKDNRFLCNYRNRIASIPLESVSLSAVLKLTGFRPKIRTLKPPKSYDSFYELLRSIHSKG